MSRVLELTRLDTAEPDFNARFDRLTHSELDWDDAVIETVSKILGDVKRRGDEAVLEYTERFDGLHATSVEALRVETGALRLAFETLDRASRDALEQAAERIRSYHEHQSLASWSYKDDDQNVLGQEVRPLDKVGVYAPGGKAAYPSSVMMGVIPAHIAGVSEIVMVVPAPGGYLNPIVLAAAHVAGVDTVFKLGGAQAVGALAFGTETVPAVDKIVGPGNIYVATAKRLVFGTVGIDMIAGPSEILVVCDGKTPPEWIAMDLFSQAEHDEQARAMLVCPDAAYLEAVEQAAADLLPEMEREGIIRESLKRAGALIKVRDLEEAMSLVNRVAPEHLELSIEDAQTWLPKVRHAGAIFLGRHTAEALGDYCAGPNHVLPTARTARFSSPLGVYDFQKRSSIINCSAKGADRLGRVASVLARGEQLTAHARSAELRVRKDNRDSSTR